MKKTSLRTGQLDDQGHLILPEEIMRAYRLAPGASLRLTMTEEGFSIASSEDHLARVYIEPTNACNLDCRTCMRNVWNEPLGWMQSNTFERILKGVQAINPKPGIFFGGIGEPLAHPSILDMIVSACETGTQVEMITNGILLDETKARRIVSAGLNRLWVSIDGSTPESYSDVRLGNALPLVTANLERLQAVQSEIGARLPRLGIAFVAMRRNIADLPEVIRLGQRLGADLFSVSNVLPHTAELRDQVLYNLTNANSEPQPSRYSPEVSLPRMNLDASTASPLSAALPGSSAALRIARQRLHQGANTCPFLEKGSLSIRWDGVVSPCLPLLHTHQSYLAENLRTSYAYAVGSILERDLIDLWHDPNYAQLRDSLRSFDFSPCTFCNSCEMSHANLEDCFGNLHPTCGGCLWAQGFIQCP